MKTKLFAIASLSCFALAGGASAATLPAETLAGWDFSQYEGPGFLSTDGSTFTSTLPANYSAKDPTYGAGSDAATWGTLYFDGSNGSSAVSASESSTEFVPSTGPGQKGSLQSNLDGPGTKPSSFMTPTGITSNFDQWNVLASEGQTFTNSLAMTATTATDIVFEVDLTSDPTLLANLWSLSFAGQTYSGTSSVGVGFSTDGSSFTPVTTVVLDTTDTKFEVPLSNIDASDVAYIRLSLDPAGGQPVIDNVSVDGVIAVPEPGFVAQMGAGALGLMAMVRHRRRHA